MPTYAQGIPAFGLKGNHFAAMVAGVQGPSGNPNVFSLQLGDLSMQMHIVPRTTFVPRSAEAEVEGLTTGDYALVVARRIRRQWVAMRVAFDVRPFPPFRLLKGTVFTVNPNGKSFTLRLNSGRNVFLRLNPHLRVQQGGQTLVTPPLLSRGMLVQALALRRGAWVVFNLTIPGAPVGTQPG